MRRIPLLAFVLAAGAVAYGPPAPVARAAAAPYENKTHGFTLKLPDTFKQTPPKPNGGNKRLAAEFYDDQPKYQSSRATNPEFRVSWWSTPKVAVTGGDMPGAGAKPEDGEPPQESDAEDVFGPKSFDDAMDGLIERNTELFGSNRPPMAERWANAKSGKTAKQKLDFRYVELNATKPKKKDDPQPKWYLFVAKIQIDRPTESVTVGFQAECATEFAKDLGPAFLGIVRSFELKEGSVAKAEEVPTDPDAFREYVKRTKVVPGWKCMDSPKKEYLLIYADGVDEKLVREIAQQVESLRSQVYEVMFPPDKPITALSIIRVCKDSEQYMAYHAPGGTAGYWSSWDKELVFYKETRNPTDSLRVLYHEAFHQYIYYSVGDVDPHSWFNEGHGDYFYGFDYKDGKWERGKSLDRVDTAQKLKREGRAPPLKDWLRWSQQQYYGDGSLSMRDNYALGWDFVYFLRTTKKKEYQGILDTYFNTLKGCVTKWREERAKEAAKAKAEGGEPPSEAEERMERMQHEEEWRDAAIDAGFKGVDLDQLYKDWMAFQP